MAEPVKVGNKFRVPIRKTGQTRCQTFTTHAAAKAWARTIESQIDELKSVGYMQPKGLTFGDLVDRHIEQFYPIKPWGRSKTAAGVCARLGIKVNIASPGFTKTALNNFNGTGSAEDGAKQPVRLALLGPDGPTGTFWEANKNVPW